MSEWANEILSECVSEYFKSHETKYPSCQKSNVEGWFDEERKECACGKVRL